MNSEAEKDKEEHSLHLKTAIDLKKEDCNDNRLPDPPHQDVVKLKKNSHQEKEQNTGKHFTKGKNSETYMVCDKDHSVGAKSKTDKSLAENINTEVDNSGNVKIAGKHQSKFRDKINTALDEKIKLPVRKQIKSLSSEKNMNDESYEDSTDAKVNDQQCFKDKVVSANKKIMPSRYGPKVIEKRWSSARDLRHNPPNASHSKRKSCDTFQGVSKLGLENKDEFKTLKQKQKTNEVLQETKWSKEESDEEKRENTDGLLKMYTDGKSLEIVNSNHKSTTINTGTKFMNGKATGNVTIHKSRSGTKQSKMKENTVHSRRPLNDRSQEIHCQDTERKEFVSEQNQNYNISTFSEKQDSKNGSQSLHKQETGAKKHTDRRLDSASNTVNEKKADKQFTVYIYIYEFISAHSDVKSYLSHRMKTKDKIPFEIVKVVNKTEKQMAEVTLMFPSKTIAIRAIGLIHKSNKNAEKKVICSYTNEDENSQREERERRQQNDFERSAEQVVETAKKAIDKHDLIIREAAAKLEGIEKKLSTKRGVSLEVFNSLMQEKQAREDKLNELNMHRKEFTRFLNSVSETLKAIKPSEKQKMVEIRKSLGSECHRLEAALPMYARREDILNTINRNRVSVILGETGSGKSTQLVQYLYQGGYEKTGLIACTQPRKIAAISLAKQVSIELASKVGHIVGYQVGMKADKSKNTKIIFMTDHVLLNECLKDETLSLFSCIIIDEAHERSIYTDLLLGMLKKCLQERLDLKIVITSATIKPDIFVSYFGGDQNCPVLKVSGRTFPVEVIYDDDEYADPFPIDYERKAVDKAIEVHTTVPVDAGDILIFLTSPSESDKCCEKFSKRVSSRNFQCLPLHGKLKPEEQQLVFEPAARGARKIIFATNSAETSITIPGVKYVIDTGVAKEMRYDTKKKMNCLNVVPVSQSSADQRKGRAGRTSPGTCYRLYSQNDYNKMEKNGKPEILRVTLGQALLKLLQLKIDPLSFDFVESPDKAHMLAVMETLQQLGAVKRNTLTDLGKWIANLPLEPRLGVLVKNGLELGVPIETMMVATCTSAGSVFYRAGSVENKKECDLKKIRFCHPGGDLLTALNVYREWDGIKEKDKGKWCVTNSVNGKTMRAIRESIKEILDILKKEMKIDIKYELCPEQNTDKEIQSLLIKCMISNLCFFLGHERAGYITTDLLQHVQIHPSSSLGCLGQQPKWVVFEQILKTTEDYITNITPVPEDTVEELLSKRDISLDKTYLKSREVSQVSKIPVGKYVFWKFVGPFHKERQDKEDLIRVACDDQLVVIDADKEKGEIALYAAQRYGSFASSLFENMLNAAPDVLKNEAREVSIGGEKSSIRAVIGLGGCVVDLLMPTEYRSLNIKQKPFLGYDLTEEDIKVRFSRYGPVDQVWQAKGKKQNFMWGKVTYLHGKHAVEAEMDINANEQEPMEVFPIKLSSLSKSITEYTVRLNWCRRLGKGIAFVYLECPEDEVMLLDKSPVTTGERSIHIQYAKQANNLMLRGLSAYVSENEIKELLAAVLDINLPPNSNRFRVVVPRFPASIPPDQMELVYQQLEQEIRRLDLKGTFRINISDVKEQTARYYAYVSFTDLEDCETVMEKCSEGIFQVVSRPVEASMDLKTSVVVQKKVFEAVKAEIDSYTQALRRKRSSSTLKRRELKSGSTVIDICSTSPRSLAEVTTHIHEIVDGETLDCETTPKLSSLFTKHYRQMVTDIEKRTRTLIFMDQRSFKITVYGLIEPRKTACQAVMQLLDSVKDVEELEVKLKGDGNPPGVMKELIMKYGAGLNGLKDSADLANVSLNCKLHKITLTGTNEAITKGCELIQAVKEKISAVIKVNENEMPSCPICICSVELNQLHRLEYCGHAYCKECLKNLVLNAVGNKKFPIECAAEGCGKHLVIRDINLQIKQGSFTSTRLAAAAIDRLVAENSSAYHYCLTPNCEMVYKVTSTGELFECPLCLCRICTSCHIQYHDGISCAMLRSAKSQDDSIRKWMLEKPKSRRQCPNCTVGIEKIDGCNHVTCKCGSHICWLCLKYFSESRKCYDHIDTVHGNELLFAVRAPVT